MEGVRTFLKDRGGAEGKQCSSWFVVPFYRSSPKSLINPKVDKFFSSFRMSLGDIKINIPVMHKMMVVTPNRSIRNLPILPKVLHYEESIAF